MESSHIIAADALTYRCTALSDIPALYAVRASTRQNAISFEQLVEWGITPESVAFGFESKLYFGMVCEAHGSIVGFCTGNTKTGEVLVLAVLPAYEGMRIGITLLDRVVAALAALGLNPIWLGCSPDPQSRSHGFYRANGWIANGQKTDSGDEILVFRP